MPAWSNNPEPLARQGVARVEVAVLLAFLTAAVALSVVALAAQQTPAPSPRADARAKHREIVASPQSWHDDFDRNGDLPWQFLAGDWEAGNGVLRGAKLRSKAFADIGVADFLYTVTLRTTSSTGQSMADVSCILFRFQDPENTYAVVPRNDGVVELTKVHNGERRPWLAYVHTGSSPFDAGTYQIRAEGPRIEVSLNGKLILRYTDPTPLYGHGIGASNDASKGEISHVRVSTLEP